jgi:antitoxin YefM
MTEVSYSYARAHLAALCDQVVDDRDTVVIRRRGGKNVSLIASEELDSIRPTPKAAPRPAPKTAPRGKR